MSLLHSTGQETFDVPFAPGESPFRVKGIAYKGHIAYTERYVPGGMAAMKAAMDPAAAAFFEQPLLAASMYDVFPLAQAGVACAQLTRLSFPQFLRIRSRVQAESDINGVYKFLMNLVTAEAIGQRIPKIIGQYFDFVETEITEVQPKRVVTVAHGLPEAVAPWFALVATTYFDTALKLAGSSTPRSAPELTGAMGTSHGVNTVSIRTVVTWT
tara:strand:+ start:532 stop:1170 length:639 start_codon:yes stop_codon:yes gene_type:complete